VIAGRLLAEIEHHIAGPAAASPALRLRHYLVSFRPAWAGGPA
jgi:hypothetical protein